MGRGNVAVHNDFEGLYYVGYHHFTDDELFEADMEYFRDAIKRRFPSFYASTCYGDRNETVLLANKLFYISFEDNQWSVAIKLRVWNTEDFNNLKAIHSAYYLKGIKEVLLEMYESIGTYAGPWTNGTIKRGQ